MRERVEDDPLRAAFEPSVGCDRDLAASEDPRTIPLLNAADRRVGAVCAIAAALMACRPGERTTP